MKRILKWVAGVLGALVGIIVLAAAVLYFLGGTKFRAHTDVAGHAVPAPTDSAARAWGAHLVETHGCAGCHAANLEGLVMIDAPPFLVVAPNLTAGAGGVGAQLDAVGWERAIRHGVGGDGRGLFIMPAEFYTGLSDEDMSAMIAYLESIAPVDNELPATEMRPLGRILAGIGAFGPTSGLVDHAAQHRPRTPAVAATREYGRYRGEILCTACHGPNLEGAPSPDGQGMPGPALAAAAQWTLDEFRTAMRTGVTPTGRELNAEAMPWQAFGRLTDDEIEAIHLYLEDETATHNGTSSQ